MQPDDSSAPDAISTARFVAYVVFASLACLAWSREVYLVSNAALPVLCVLLLPRRELTRKVGGRDALAMALAIPVVIAMFAVLSSIAEQLEAHLVESAASSPWLIASAWVLLIYAGARRWRKQLTAGSSGGSAR